MLNSPILDVIIGVSVTYLILSLLCSTLLEISAGFLKLRSKDLEEGVRSLVGPGSANAPGSAAAKVFEDFFAHPLIRGLTRQGKVPDWQKRYFVGLTGDRKPSYITSKAFASTLFDVIAPEDAEAGSKTLAALQAKLDTLPDGAFKDVLKPQLKALTTQATEANIRVAINQLKDADVRRGLLQIIDAVGEMNEKLARLRVAVDGLPDGLVKEELHALLTPASIANIRNWVAGVASAELQKELNALLGPARAHALRENIEKVENLELKRSLQALLRDTSDNIVDVRKEVENWYDQAMERVSGWYKRRAQLLLILIAIPVVGALNADTITMITAFWQDDAVRQVAVDSANEIAKQSNATTQSTDTIRDNLSGLTAFGWRARSDNYKDPREEPSGIEWLWKAFGLAISVGALSLGADFWFNILKKAVNMRSSGAPQANTAAAAAVGQAPTTGSG